MAAAALLAQPLFGLLPRLRPCAGGIEPASLMDERQLVQTICAFRLLAPEVELSLSTRESPWFRDRVIPLAINNVSAFSKTQPGVTPTIIRSLSSSRRTMAVDLKKSPARWLPAACSRYGKTGTAGWDAPRKPHDEQCKRLIFLRACTR